MKSRVVRFTFGLAFLLAMAANVLRQPRQPKSPTGNSTASWTSPLCEPSP